MCSLSLAASLSRSCVFHSPPGQSVLSERGKKKLPQPGQLDSSYFSSPSLSLERTFTPLWPLHTHFILQSSMTLDTSLYGWICDWIFVLASMAFYSASSFPLLYLILLIPLPLIFFSIAREFVDPLLPVLLRLFFLLSSREKRREERREH